MSFMLVGLGQPGLLLSSNSGEPNGGGHSQSDILRISMVRQQERAQYARLFGVQNRPVR
jgi:hypothetical protein